MSYFEAIEKYKKSGIITTELMMDAYRAVLHIDEFKGTRRLIPNVAQSYLKNIECYREINEAAEEISRQSRLAEIAVWFGRPDLATDDEVNRSRLETQIYPCTYKIKNGEKSLQNYYRNETARGHSYKKGDFQALLWGSAGRVLLTLRNVSGNYDLTLIYDEDAAYPRGGIQSLHGKKDDILGLIRLIRENDLDFKFDNEVGII